MEPGAPTLPPCPTPEFLFLEAAPYEEFLLDDESIDNALKTQFYMGSFDAHCVDCGRSSVFSNSHVHLKYSAQSPKSGQAIHVDQIRHNKQESFVTGCEGFPSGALNIHALRGGAAVERCFEVKCACQRDRHHVMYFQFRVWNTPIRRIAKIGQSPSIADLQKPGVQKYRKILGDERFRELIRAIGLHAVGVGIGSFVYLRRIYERLIEDARKQAAEFGGFVDPDFDRKRTEEKIKALAHWLPDVMVENSKIYSILSLGLHELTESECNKFFGALLVGIELILDELLAKHDRDRKAASAMAEINRIYADVGNPRTSK